MSAGQPSAPSHGRLLVARMPPAYASDVVITLTRIARTSSGTAALRAVAASGHRLRIHPPPHTEPPNAAVHPLDLAAATNGGTDVEIAFDPCQWPSAVAPELPTADAALFVLISQALSALGGGADLANYARASAVEVEADNLAQYLAERGLVPARPPP